MTITVRPSAARRRATAVAAEPTAVACRERRLAHARGSPEGDHHRMPGSLGPAPGAIAHGGLVARFPRDHLARELLRIDRAAPLRLSRFRMIEAIR